MKCIGVNCREERESNSVCADVRCRKLLPKLLPNGDAHEPPTKIFVCPVHVSEAIDALYQNGAASFRCSYCNQPWVYVIGERD